MCSVDFLLCINLFVRANPSVPYGTSPLKKGRLGQKAVPLVGRCQLADGRAEGRVASPHEGKRATCGEGVNIRLGGIKF